MEGAKVQSLKDAFPSFFIASVNVKNVSRLRKRKQEAPGLYFNLM